MYHYSTGRKHDAVLHAIDAKGTVIYCGDTTLRWDDIYGYVTERRAGQLVARHVPILDPATGAITGMREKEIWRDAALATQPDEPALTLDLDADEEEQFGPGNPADYGDR